MNQFSQIVIPTQAVVSTAVTTTVSNQPPLTHGVFITTVSGFVSGEVTVSVEGYDPASDGWYPIIVGAVISSNGLQSIQVGPNFPIIPNSSVTTLLPSIFRVTATPDNPSELTVSVGVNLAP